MSTVIEPKVLPGVDRRTGLSRDDFERQYMAPRQPVVITDALRNWKALGRWTPAFFREKFGDRLVNIDGQQRPLGPFIDEVLASTPDHPAPYLRNEELNVVFPEIADEILPLPSYLKPNWLNRHFGPPEAKVLHRMGQGEIYIGGAGRSFPVVHWDFMHTNAFLMQLYGRKQYFVYAPDQTPFMYQVKGDPNRSAIDSVEHPDLEKFPLFAQAQGYSFTLDPGEMLFIPCGWWHTVRMVSTSITISVNTANAANWSELRQEFCRLNGHSRRKRLQLNAYLRWVGAISRLGDLFH
jgi:hypothetical protein